MSNTLEKLFIETVSTTETEPVYLWAPSTTSSSSSGQSWVPGTTTTSYVYWGYDSTGTKVYSDSTGSDQSASEVFSFSYLGSNGWETVTVVGQEAITTTTPGSFVLSQPSSTTSTAVVTKDPNLGWNSSARSVDSLLGEGTVSFTAKVDEVGAVVGLNEVHDSLGTDYFEISFSIYLKNGYYKVSEQGIFKTSFLPYILTDTFSISRSGSSIYYAKNNVVFYKSLTTTIDELLLDVSLYAGGDAVYNATITNTSIIELRTAILVNTTSTISATPRATADLGITSNLVVFNISDGDGVHSYPIDLVGTSDLVINKMFGYSNLIGSSNLISVGHHVNEIDGVFGSMTASLSSGYFTYSSLIGSLSPMTAKLSVGSVTNTFTYINAGFVPLIATGISFVGQTTTPMTMNLSSMTALLSDKPYASISGAFKSMNAFAVQYPPDIRDIGNNALVKEYTQTLEDIRYSQLTNIVEQIVIALNTNQTVNIKSLVTDYLTILDSILLRFNGTLSDSLIVASTLTAIISRIDILTESLSALDTTSTRGVLADQLISLIGILEEIGYRYVDSVSETILITSTISSLYNSLNTIVDSILLIGSSDGGHTQKPKIVEVITLNPIVSSSSLFNTDLLDSFVVSVPTAKGSDKYLAYLLSPETNSISNYDNYNFDGCTKFDGKYLFYNSTGLYEYGGQLDDNALIRSKIKTVAYGYDSSNLKQIPSVYLGLNSSGATYLKVSVDGKGEVTYKLNKKTDGLQTQKIDIGKGLIGRYFQFEVITDAPDFNMESIEFFPIELKRKL